MTIIQTCDLCGEPWKYVLKPGDGGIRSPLVHLNLGSYVGGHVCIPCARDVAMKLGHAKADAEKMFPGDRAATAGNAKDLEACDTGVRRGA